MGWDLLWKLKTVKNSLKKERRDVAKSEARERSMVIFATILVSQTYFWFPLKKSFFFGTF